MSSTLKEHGLTSNIEYLLPLFSNRQLQLILMPTEKCNFRCTYCYEAFDVGKMNSETQDGIIALMKRRAPSLSFLNLSWFGGEPLLAKDIVLRISRVAHTLARMIPELNYVGDMTTNASMLTFETLHELAEVGITKYQITLDGDRTWHNKTRLDIRGHGTFDKIWNNLMAIRDSSEEVNIRLRLHYSHQSVADLGAFVDLITQEFLHDERFSVFFHEIVPLGGPNDSLIQILSKKDKERYMTSLNQQVRKTRLTGEDKAPDICYAAKPTSFVVRADGKVGKCTVALSDERNVVGRLTRAGQLNIEQGHLEPWLQGIEDLDRQKLHCPWSVMQS